VITARNEELTLTAHTVSHMDGYQKSTGLIHILVWVISWLDLNQCTSARSNAEDNGEKNTKSGHNDDNK
jgi:hypothetical protein